MYRQAILLSFGFPSIASDNDCVGYFYRAENVCFAALKLNAHSE
jgi:hypothetical protein